MNEFRLKHILSILIFLCSSERIVAQTVQADKNTGRIYAQPYNGSLVQQIMPGEQPTRGSKYLADSALSVRIFKDGRHFNYDEALVNLESGIIIFNPQYRPTFVEFRDIDSLYLNSSVYSYRTGLGVVENVFKNEDFELVRQIRVRLKKADYKPHFDQGTKYDEWIREQDYYVSYEGEFYKVDRVNSFRKFLEREDYNQLQNFIRSEKISQHPDEEELIAILNGLTQF